MEHPNILVYLAMLAYVPFTLACFQSMGGRRAMLVSLLAGWLFLPAISPIGRTIPIFHTKEMYLPAVVLLASLLLDSQAWGGLRLRLLDLPVLVYCLAPMATSLSNGLGAYDGASGIFESSMAWGVPYLLGRVYLRTPAALLEAAKALVGAAIIYMVLCWWEIRMSPQLHRQLYGYHQHSFPQHVRDGHFRPMLFMAHGLEVALLMASATVVAYWLWRTRAAQAVLRLPLTLVTPALLVTTYLCRSVSALLLALGGIVVLEATRRTRVPILALVLALTPAAYCAVRIAGVDVTSAVALTRDAFGENRAESLRIRVVNDEMLTERALLRPWLGWGRWGDSRVVNEEGRDVTVVDGLWIIVFGVSGLVGLVSAGLFLVLPAVSLMGRFPARTWGHPRLAPAAVLMVVVCMWTVDALFNSLTSPLYFVLAGGVLTLCATARTRRPVRPRVRAGALAPGRPSLA